MKTFENLEFKNHELCSLDMFKNHKQAKISFNKGFLTDFEVNVIMCKKNKNKWNL